MSFVPYRFFLCVSEVVRCSALLLCQISYVSLGNDGSEDSFGRFSVFLKQKIFEFVRSNLIVLALDFVSVN